MARKILQIVLILSSIAPALRAQAPGRSTDTLQFIVSFSRHGVRSPTGLPAQYNKFSRAAWPGWDVPPGILTAHGAHLMELFGAYDRQQLSAQGLLSATGCADASKVTFYADSDQRTRETGKALAAGLFPGCRVPVAALPEETHDPLFHLAPDRITPSGSALAVAAIAGRIGSSPDNLTAAYRPQLAAFDKLLATCGTPAPDQTKRNSLLDIPASLSAGQSDHLAEMKGPINTASTLSENILLEYTDGLDLAAVGWGCVDGAMVRSLIGLHTAATDITQRTPAIANVQSANLLNLIASALQQAVEQHPIPGALGKPQDRALFLIGHDTNLLNMAGTLGLSWIADGRRDDTPPGSNLTFELWKKPTGSFFVKLYLSTQTLEQMRASTPLTLDAPPVRVPVFIPGCSQADMSCDWQALLQLLRQSPANARTLAADHP